MRHFCFNARISLQDTTTVFGVIVCRHDGSFSRSEGKGRFSSHHLLIVVPVFPLLLSFEKISVSVFTEGRKQKRRGIAREL